MMIELFHTVSEDCSRIVTERYSTSFASAIRLLHKDLQSPVFSIYGFVRLADEIVDTFHEHDKNILLKEFRKETFDSIDRQISLNPILHSFQRTVHDYAIDRQLIGDFFTSMEKDLCKQHYTEEEYREYIYGSAEVVGLMCLHVFLRGQKRIV